MQGFSLLSYQILWIGLLAPFTGYKPLYAHTKRKTMKSNETILNAIPSYTDWQLHYKEDCLDAMKQAQIEILEEVLERYYNQSFSQTIRGLVEDLKKELK